eukprot:gene4121-4367_t
MTLPDPVLTCLAGALTYLKPFGLSGVLRNTAGFRPLTGMGQEMLLDGNVLRQLEIMAAGVIFDKALLTASTAPADPSAISSVLTLLPAWLSGLRLDLERVLTRVTAGTAAPAEAVGLWSTLVQNDFLQLFKSKERFPEVHAQAAAVAAAEAHLQGLLPSLAAAAGVAVLDYVSIQNQGSFLGGDSWLVGVWAMYLLLLGPGVPSSSLIASGRGFGGSEVKSAVAAVAQLDALHALATVAGSTGYCRPEIIPSQEEGGRPQQLVISDGKHPMLDLALDGRAVGNSIDLRWDGVRAAVVTGPNMGGKSVLIRQAALTVIMAQVGSWVPAAFCQLSVFDGVYCRMGASDSLLQVKGEGAGSGQGRSTFAEELGEASHILSSATNRSLVIMDELGRGTATHDGVAIASATLQYLVSQRQCLSLFVTHYPEVAAAAGIHGGGSKRAAPAVAAEPDDEAGASPSEETENTAGARSAEARPGGSTTSYHSLQQHHGQIWWEGDANCQQESEAVAFSATAAILFCLAQAIC